MHGLYDLPDYSTALAEFSATKKQRCFLPVHLQKTTQKCPICEVLLDNSITRDTIKGRTTTIKPTIDHYRPTKLYGFLEFAHENFILMCLDCNQHYKQHSFPLYPEGSIRAQNTGELTTEMPLIVNPIFDNPLDLFDLIFKLHPDGRKTLELTPRQYLSDYLTQKASKTIALFKLGNCDMATDHPIDNCRIEIHTTNYELFLNLALARDNKKNFTLTLKNNPKLKDYGFFQFIIHRQFEIKGMI